MSLRFAVVREAPADLVLATELADRVFCEAISWLDSDLLPHQRAWVAQSPDGQALTWTNLAHLARLAGIRVHGHFNGEPALPDARAALRAIRFVQQVFPDLDAILLIRDRDDQPERRNGLEQAREQDGARIAIILGFAVVEREAWVLSGFVPQDDDETSRLDALRAELGFHPCLQSHDLDACKNDLAKRSAKRVLHALTAGDRDRERRCWLETALDVLRTRGQQNGLAEYLLDVRRLAAMIDPGANR